MNKNSILLIDPNFDTATAVNCNLLLKITADTISYAIIDDISNQVKAVFDEQECKDVAKILSKKFKNDVYLTLPFKKIIVSVYTPNAIFIPNDLIDKNNLNNYSQYFSTDSAANLYVQPFATYGFASVFTLQQFLEQTLTNTLNNSKKHQLAATLLYLANGTKENAIYIDFTANSFNLLYINQEKVIFQNYYEIANTEEFNYYILLIINQLNINTAIIPAKICGIIHLGDANYKCLEKYFHHTTFAIIAQQDLNQEVLDDMPAHYYSSLLALNQCV